MVVYFFYTTLNSQLLVRKMKHANPSRHYKEVTDYEIKQKAQQLKIEKYNPDIIRDMANLASGGSLRPLKDVLSDVDETYQFQTLPDSDNEFRLPNQSGHSYTQYRQVAIDAWKNTEKDYRKNIHDFLSHVDFDQFDGSPLEKAHHLQAYLNSENGKEREDGDGNSRISAFGKGDGGKKIAEKLHEKVELLKKLTPGEQQSLLGEEFEENDSLILKAKNVDSNMLEILRAAGNIDKISQISTVEKGIMRKKHDGNIVRHRKMRGIEEFGRISTTDLAQKKQLLINNIVNNDYYVKENYVKEKGTPFIILLVDDSGSMCSNSKKEKALGIIFNLLNRVEKEGVCILFSFFETHCHKFHYFHPENPEEIKKFFESFLKYTFNKNVTRVGRCIKEAIVEFDKIVETEKRYKISKTNRHIVIVNDGDDDASDVTFDDLRGSKLHGFILDSSNDDIRKLCNKSGGVYRESL